MILKIPPAFCLSAHFLSPEIISIERSAERLWPENLAQQNTMCHDKHVIIVLFFYFFNRRNVLFTSFISCEVAIVLCQWNKGLAHHQEPNSPHTVFWSFCTHAWKQSRLPPPKRTISVAGHIINGERDNLTVVENSLAFSQDELIRADPVTPHPPPYNDCFLFASLHSWFKDVLGCEGVCQGICEFLAVGAFHRAKGCTPSCAGFSLRSTGAYHQHPGTLKAQEKVNQQLNFQGQVWQIAQIYSGLVVPTI